MACYKVIDTSPRFLAVDLENQLLIPARGDGPDAVLYPFVVDWF